MPRHFSALTGPSGRRPHEFPKSFSMDRSVAVVVAPVEHQPPANPSTQARIVNFKSIAYDVPIVEYRPYRSFSSNQSSSVVFQLFAAADVPRSASTAFPVGAPTPDLRTVWSIGVRLVFDWRYYYSY